MGDVATYDTVEIVAAVTWTQSLGLDSNPTTVALNPVHPLALVYIERLSVLQRDARSISFTESFCDSYR